MQSLRSASLLKETSVALRSFAGGSDAAWKSQLMPRRSLGDWTLVREEKSGQAYYWNERTSHSSAFTISH